MAIRPGLAAAADRQAPLAVHPGLQTLTRSSRRCAARPAPSRTPRPGPARAGGSSGRPDRRWPVTRGLAGVPSSRPWMRARPLASEMRLAGQRLQQRPADLAAQVQVQGGDPLQAVEAGPAVDLQAGPLGLDRQVADVQRGGARASPVPTAIDRVGVSSGSRTRDRAGDGQRPFAQRPPGGPGDAKRQRRPGRPGSPPGRPGTAAAARGSASRSPRR